MSIDNNWSDSTWITDYLDAEAARVIVDDALDEIERGLRLVPLVAASTQLAPRRSLTSVALVAAAAAAMLIGGAALLFDSSTPRQIGTATAPPDGSGGEDGLQDTVPSETTPPVGTTVAATTLVETTVPFVNHLPEGGLNLAGQVPNCTQADAEVYECWLPTSFNPAGDFVNPVGIVETYVNDSSLIAGGCRSTSTDARQWICYVGQRAVAENLVLTYGGAKLGDWQPNEYIAG